MQLEKEQLEELERLGGLFFAPEKVAIILQVDKRMLQEAIREEGTLEHQAYWRGFLQSEAEIRQGVLELAKNGSSPAQVMAKELIQEAKMEAAI